MKYLIPFAIALALAGCGGASDPAVIEKAATPPTIQSAPPPQPAVQIPVGVQGAPPLGGVYRASILPPNTVETITQTLLTIDGSGNFYFEVVGNGFEGAADTCTTRYGGTLQPSAVLPSAYEAFYQVLTTSTCTVPSIGGFVYFDFSAGVMTGVNPSARTPLNHSLDFTWSLVSLSTQPPGNQAAGNWLLLDGSVLSISSDGAAFLQDSATGCVMNGQVSIPYSGVNVYDITSTLGNCNQTALNGLTASGVLTIDSSVQPALMYGGVTVPFSVYQDDLQLMLPLDSSAT